MLDQILIGLIVALVGGAVFYAFRVKQLYLVIPRLFSYSGLSTSGKHAEIRVFNKGRSAELDVQVMLDPAGSYEIVASTDSTCNLENSTIAVPRIAPGDDYSVLLLVEQVELTTERISRVSSSTTKGRILNKLNEVPPNIGNVLLAALGWLILAAIPISIVEWMDFREKQLIQERVKNISSSLSRDWSRLEWYAKTDFSRLYSLGEFPIHLSDTQHVDTRITFTFTIINRAAAPLDLSVYSDWPFKHKDPEPWLSEDVVSQTIQPSSSRVIDVVLYWPQQESGLVSFQFNMDVGADRYMRTSTEVLVELGN